MSAFSQDLKEVSDESLPAEEIKIQMPTLAKFETAEFPAKIRESELKNQNNATYRFPDKNKRFKRYVNRSVGPTAFIGPVIGATIQTIGDNPPEWEKNGKGFMRRFASNVGENIIEESVIYAGSEALRQDPKYYKCECSGIGKRTVHALKSGFTARTRSGNTVFAPQKVAAPFVSNITSTTVWYPERFGVKDGLRRGGYSLAFGVGFNLIREFIF